MGYNRYQDAISEHQRGHRMPSHLVGLSERMPDPPASVKKGLPITASFSVTGDVYRGNLNKGVRTCSRRSVLRPFDTRQQHLLPGRADVRLRLSFVLRMVRGPGNFRRFGTTMIFRELKLCFNKQQVTVIFLYQLPVISFRR